MKIIAVAVLFAAISGLLAAVTNFYQGREIAALRNEITCLKQGRMYVPPSFCADLPTN